jgi:ornithine carbamoyltransferase
MDACTGADLVTTDDVVGVGFEPTKPEQHIQDWCVDAEMMQAAKPDALFSRCLHTAARSKAR